MISGLWSRRYAHAIFVFFTRASAVSWPYYCRPSTYSEATLRHGELTLTLTLLGPNSYSKPRRVPFLQKLYLRISLLPLVFSICAFISLFRPNEFILLDAVRHVYEVPSPDPDGIETQSEPYSVCSTHTDISLPSQSLLVCGCVV